MSGTVLVTAHPLHDIAETADDVVVIGDGRITAPGADGNVPGAVS